MELIDRKTALGLGLTTYFTGKECKNGHIAPRKVGCGSCSTCCVARTKRWREEGKQSDFNISGKELPSLEYLNECLEYKDGSLIWKARPRSHFKSEKGWKISLARNAGKVAGHYHKTNNYLEVRVDDHLYKGHRLIYKLVSGEEPVGMVDHADGDVTNNRFENLRIATSQENARNASKRPRNASSIYKGVANENGKWASYITVDDKYVRSFFDTELEAALDYDNSAKELFGEFAKLNFPELQDE